MTDIGFDLTISQNLKKGLGLVVEREPLASYFGYEVNKVEKMIAKLKRRATNSCHLNNRQRSKTRQLC
ncbi:MAG: hypothetical protein QXI35_08135 [Candidatus Nezhaarchaeales archaeon]